MFYRDFMGIKGYGDAIIDMQEIDAIGLVRYVELNCPAFCLCLSHPLSLAVIQ